MSIERQSAMRPRSQPDVTLLLGLGGVIRKAACSDTVCGEPVDAWVGRKWVDTVHAECSDDVKRMLSDAAATGVSTFSQIAQIFPNGAEIPIDYATVRLGKASGLIAIGKNVSAVRRLQSRLVAAQRAREHDYWKLRELETRYRLLFDATSDAIVLLAGNTLRVIDANPAAIRGLGLGPGQELLPEFAPQEQVAIRALLQRAREQDRQPGILVHAGSGGAAWGLRASQLSTEPVFLFLLQFTSLGVAVFDGEPGCASMSPDRPSFLRSARAGDHLSEPSGWPGKRVTQVEAQTTALLPGLTRQGNSGLVVPNGSGELGADVPTRDALQTATIAGAASVGDIESLPATRLAMPPGIDRLGEAPLPTLVHEATESLERQYIEAALRCTGGKRSPAAALLGVSRQSLHVKLVRYGLAGRTRGTRDLDE